MRSIEVTRGGPVSFELASDCRLQPVLSGGVGFEIASPEDEPELRRFSRDSDVPGMVRFTFDRSPDYFSALRVEGRQSEALICRESGAGRVIATGHRSIKPVFVNGEVQPIGYLSGLRVDSAARNGRILARGYGVLRQLHADGCAPFYLTTIMEDNDRAKSVLPSGRCGLPHYHDLGRFCCMALSLHPTPGRGASSLTLRQAAPGDGAAILAFLQHGGRSRQFFPDYKLDDFGVAGGLLQGLKWEDVLLAFRDRRLVGMMAAWDQRAFRQWRITGYSRRLAWLRTPLNLLAGLRRMPTLPRPGSPLNYFILSLVCVDHDDPEIFGALLNNIVNNTRKRYDFCLAGLHERDPLLPALTVRPHFPLPSRLYAVAWEDGIPAVRKLNPELIPYLELGSL